MNEPAATLLRSEFDVLTIGHSNLPAERFMGLLTSAGVTAIADVRSVPFSRRYPWFSAKTLAARLRGAGIAYLPLGEILGGRPRDPGLYRDGVADYEKMAATPQFKAGLDQVGELRSRFCRAEGNFNCYFNSLVFARYVVGTQEKPHREMGGAE